MAAEVRAILTSVVVGLVLATACGGDTKPAATAPPDEMRQYAKAMEGWWREVTGAEVPTTPIVVHIVLDSERVQRAAPKPLPSIAVPRLIRTEHELLVASLEGWANAKGEAEFAGLYVGLAAYFCNPRSSGLKNWTDWRGVEALQSWRDTNDPCLTWAGNRPFANEYTTTDLRYYQFGCGVGIHDLDDFGAKFHVYTYDLGRRCSNRDRWATALDAATQLWTAELTVLCTGQYQSAADGPADAIASCK